MAELVILGPVGEPRKRPPSPADEADAQALDRAVEAMIQNVLSGWDHNRPLSSLNRADLRRIATAAITGWILKRAELARCGNEEIGNQLTSDAGFVERTSAPSRGLESPRTSTPLAAVSPRQKGRKK